MDPPWFVKDCVNNSLTMFGWCWPDGPNLQLFGSVCQKMQFSAVQCPRLVPQKSTHCFFLMCVCVFVCLLVCLFVCLRVPFSALFKRGKSKRNHPFSGFSILTHAHTHTHTHPYELRKGVAPMPMRFQAQFSQVCHLAPTVKIEVPDVSF